MKKNLFDDSGNFYDLLYEDKNSDIEIDYIEGLFSKFSRDVKNILELGSGTGRHGSRLAKKGFSVVGIEKSRTMVSMAKNEEGFEIQIGDITQINLKKKFDIVLSLFHVLSYQTKNKQIDDCFRVANEHLEIDGLFIFDFWYAPAVQFQKPEIRLKKFENEKIKITRLAEPINKYNENIVLVKYNFWIEDKINSKLKKFEEVHPMRYFSIPEIEFYSDKYNFEIIKVEEWLSKREISEKTWSPCIVLRKI